MGAQFDRLRYEVFQNLLLSPMNTGLLRPAVATVPTVYGIETKHTSPILPFIVLMVATVPTVYGIETRIRTIQNFDKNYIVATVPTVYGIETIYSDLLSIRT